MKTNVNRRQTGLTTAELLVVVAVVAVMVAILLPAFSSNGTPARRIHCVNNLKQVAVGLRLFAHDNDEKYPFELLTGTNARASYFQDGFGANPTNLWKLLQLTSPEFISPRILVCSADRARIAAENFSTNGSSSYSKNSFSHPSKRNNALSYFLALDAKEARPAMLLAGDRNLARDSDKTDSEPGRNYLTGEQRLGSTAEETKHLRWNNDIHERAGNVAFMDGSAQQLTSGKLRQAVMNTGDPTNRIWLPQ